MRKRLAYIILALSVLAAAGCSRAKEIPRSELKEIFKEAFIANAYYQTNHNVMARMITDSLDIYRPILKRHGYTVRDLERTVQVISRQKSRSLSDVVERAIEELRSESQALDTRVAVLDTVDVRAGRLFMQMALREEHIAVEKISDTAKLRFRVPIKEGSYRLSYAYLVDSLEQNGSIRVSGTIFDSLGGRRTVFNQGLFSRGRQRPEPQSIETTAKDTMLVLVMGNYLKGMGQPHLFIDSLELTYFLPKEQALNSLMKLLYHPNFPPYSNYGEEDAVPQDSSALRPDTLGVAPVGSGDPR